MATSDHPSTSLPARSPPQSVSRHVVRLHTRAPLWGRPAVIGPRGLEIRSPGRNVATDDPAVPPAKPSPQRHPMVPSKLRFDPPPIAPPEAEGDELEAPTGGGGGGRGATEQHAAAGTPGAKPVGKPGRRKPWQRAPVPLDRPLALGSAAEVR